MPSRESIPLIAILGILLLSVSLLVFVVKDLRRIRHLRIPNWGFQTDSGNRSTMDIIYLCLTTMIVCSITALHFDLPSEEHSVGPWFMGTPRKNPLKALNKAAKWIVGVLMPEAIVIAAWDQYVEVLRDFVAMKRYQGWTFKHSFFALMGGFYVGEVQAWSGRMLVLCRANLDQSTCEKLGREIADKSKADLLPKSIAIIQITSFSLGIVARAAASLTISPLEYFTCAQVFCALLLYTFWFSKPYNVDEAIYLLPKPGEGLGEYLEECAEPFCMFDLLFYY